MSLPGNIKKSTRGVAELWQQYFRRQYDKNDYRLIKMLTKKAGLGHLNHSAEFSAGLLWILMYDLMGAVSDKALKNIELIEEFVQLLAESFEVESKALWKILHEMSGITLPHGIFLELYYLFDDKKVLKITDNEAIQGFAMVANKVKGASNLGYLFEHANEITRSKPA
jgi:ribosomal protein S17E